MKWIRIRPNDTDPTGSGATTLLSINIMQRLSYRKMNVDPDVNYDELARSTDDFNGAQCKAVCVEAGIDPVTTTVFKIVHLHRSNKWSVLLPPLNQGRFFFLKFCFINSTFYICIIF